MLLETKAGDVIWYFKIDSKKGGVSLNPKEIDILKYKEMHMTDIKDILQILGYGGNERIEESFDTACKLKKQNKTGKWNLVDYLFYRLDLFSKAMREKSVVGSTVSHAFASPMKKSSRA
jgi:hypothetical protein